MKTRNDYTQENLNNLLTRNLDAEAGYKVAAENVKEPNIKNYFLNKSLEREVFCKQLSKELKSYDLEPESKTSIAADLHRTWINTKGVLGMNDTEEILAEVIRGEEKALEDFEETLNGFALLKPTQDLIEDQKNKIEASLEKAKAMKNLSFQAK